MKRLPSCTSGRWHPAFTDITAKGADKGEGIRAMAAHFRLNIQHTIAFGDGGNDSSMIKAAGIGVAMGNALESLKEEADYTTTSVDNDGVFNALRHLCLIKSIAYRIKRLKKKRGTSNVEIPQSPLARHIES